MIRDVLGLQVLTMFSLVLKQRGNLMDQTLAEAANLNSINKLHN